MKKLLLASLLVLTSCGTAPKYEAAFVVVSEQNSEPEGLIEPWASVTIWLLPSDRFWTDFVAPKLGTQETASQLRKRFAITDMEGRRDGRRTYDQISVRTNSEFEFEAFRDAVVAYLTDSYDRERAAALEYMRAELARRPDPELAEVMKHRISETETSSTRYWLLVTKKPIQSSQPTRGVEKGSWLDY